MSEESSSVEGHRARVALSHKMGAEKFDFLRPLTNSSMAATGTRTAPSTPDGPELTPSNQLVDLRPAKAKGGRSIGDSIRTCSMSDLLRLEESGQ